MLGPITQGDRRSIGSQWTPDDSQQEAAAGVWRFPRERQVGRGSLLEKCLTPVEPTRPENMYDDAEMNRLDCSCY